MSLINISPDQGPQVFSIFHIHINLSPEEIKWNWPDLIVVNKPMIILGGHSFLLRVYSQLSNNFIGIVITPVWSLYN